MVLSPTVSVGFVLLLSPRVSTTGMAATGGQPRSCFGREGSPPGSPCFAPQGPFPRYSHGASRHAPPPPPAPSPRLAGELPAAGGLPGPEGVRPGSRRLRGPPVPLQQHPSGAPPQAGSWGRYPWVDGGGLHAFSTRDFDQPFASSNLLTLGFLPSHSLASAPFFVVVLNNGSSHPSGGTTFPPRKSQISNQIDA